MRCDVIIDGMHVYVNGHEIPNVLDIDINQSVNTPSLREMTIRLYPTSVISGKPPKSTFGDSSDPDATVDIDAAIERARKRVHGK